MRSNLSWTWKGFKQNKSELSIFGRNWKSINLNYILELIMLLSHIKIHIEPYIRQVIQKEH
jgi:hypothetical protein